MEDYIHKLRNIKHDNSGGAAIKKVLIIVSVVAVVIIIALIALAIMAATWLFNKSNDLRQTGENITKQAQTLSTPLKLEPYISGGQVSTEKLQSTFNGLPSQLQGIWLDQLKAEVEKLKTQAGVSDETITSLTTVYDNLRQSQNK